MSKHSHKHTRGEGKEDVRQQTGAVLRFLAQSCSANVAGSFGEMLQRTSPCSECCRMGRDGERIPRSPLREQGVCDGEGQVEVRSGPEHLNHTQGFASEPPCSNLRTRNSILCTEENVKGDMKDDMKMCHLL